MRHRTFFFASVPFFAAAIITNACSDESSKNGTTNTPTGDGGSTTDGSTTPPTPEGEGGVCNQGSFAWSFAGGGPAAFDVVRGVAVDKDGNAWVTGTFIGSAKWGESTLTAVDKVHTTAFVAKVDPNGVVVFAKAIGGDAENTTHVGERVRVDAKGNAYVVGTFTKKLTVDGVTVQQDNTFGAGSAFVMKFDATGKATWAAASAGYGADEFGHDLFVDENEDLYLTGSYNGRAKFINRQADGGTEEVLTKQSEGGGEKVFVAKYSQQNQRWVWAKGFIGHGDGGNAGGEGFGVVGHGDGTISVTGLVHTDLDVDGTILGASEGSFLVRLGKDDGHVVWATQFSNEDAAPALASAIAADGLGNVFVTGLYKGTIIFQSADVAKDGGAAPDAGDDTASRTGTTGTGLDMFVVKYDANGRPTWFRHGGIGNGQTQGNDIAFDGNDSVYVVGKKQGDAAFDGFILTKSGDLFVARYSSAGEIQWISGSRNRNHAGGEGYAVAAPLAATSVFVGGNFSVETTFGTQNITSAGEDDGFLARLCK